ncbi:MAG: phospholipase D-like domain-containing protein [Sediminibacterium sp.]|nr:phospholipase D-like domain-containing protein [Sediminibacterium sp.]
MKFLANNKSDNHLTVLTDNLKLYDEAFFAVAFLKISGLNKLIQTIKEFLKSGGQITIIAGQNFALTEPEALHTLRKLFLTYPTSKLYLAKANSANSVFHPKLYLFKSKNDCCIISGSANITEGGLTNNKETSLIADCNDTDAIWNEAKKYFDTLVSADTSDEATLLVIKQYETFYEQQKQHNKKAKPIPTKTKSQLAFDYNNLLKHFQKFDNATRQENFKDKLYNYREAKKVLDEIADNSRLTQKQFEPLLDTLVGSKEEYNLWHSGSLFRLRRSVYPYYKEFRDLVKYIRENKSLSATVVFENAKEKVKMIEGAAVNYITEIMMTYNPKDFANMNKNPITVLRQEGGVNIKASSSSFTGVDYEEYCDLVKEISSKLGLQNMLEADSFFNDIYWKI